MVHIPKGTKVQIHLPDTYLNHALGTVYNSEGGGFLIELERRFQASDGTIFFNKGDVVFLRRWEFYTVRSQS